MFATRVLLFAGEDRTRILRIVHAAEAQRLVKAGQARPLYSGRRIRALVFTGGGEDNPAPWSRVIEQPVEGPEGIVGYCYAMKLLEADRVAVI